MKSTLIFDGDCGICRYWVNYWKTLTGDRIVYRPYQEAAADFPDIPLEAFKAAIQLIEPGGQRYSAAAASFRVLRHAPARTAWWWCYSHLAGFAAVSEFSYSFLSAHRGLLNRLTKFLWGPALSAERYELVSWIFLRVFGAVYIAAFLSLSVQIEGLIGHQGILPAAAYLPAAHNAYGDSAYRLLPTLFWFNTSDSALLVGTFVGALLGLLVVLDRFTRSALVGSFVLYLSYVHVGQDFMSFQWDTLLLETGFLAIFLTGGSRIVIWLFRWLAFRFLFLAGIVKILSGDPTWRSLTALDYHFWTQPLPTPLAWYVAQLPQWLLMSGTAVTLVVELVCVFLIFLPRRLRAAAAVCVLLLLQLPIVLTGNYNFFNLLTMLLCIFLFDDAALSTWVPSALRELALRLAPRSNRVSTVVAAALALLVVPVGLNRIWLTLEHNDLPVFGTLSSAVSPFFVINGYGLFAVMTTTRPEVVIEGSEDLLMWREYTLRYQPGPLSRPARWNIPHQPRLDWQMWFAALGDWRESPWVVDLMHRLLEGSAPVVSLFDSVPFAQPPRYVRARLYQYRFADRHTHELTGQWWVREAQEIYFPAVSLKDFERRNVN